MLSRNVACLIAAPQPENAPDRVLAPDEWGQGSLRLRPLRQEFKLLREQDVPRSRLAFRKRGKEFTRTYRAVQETALPQNKEFLLSRSAALHGDKSGRCRDGYRNDPEEGQAFFGGNVPALSHDQV